MYSSIIKKDLIIASVCALIISSIIFAWYRDWIIIAIPSKIKYSSATIPRKTTKKIALFYRKKEALVKNMHEQEIKELMWTENDDKNILTLVCAWATFVNEEDILHKKITVQASAIDTTCNELLLSFDRLPFNKYDAAFKKYLTLESLCATISKEFPYIETIRFLIDHQPIRDEHLDFSHPWPIHIQQTSTPSLVFHCWNKKPMVVVIDPYGDANRTGRAIDDVFERSITLRCAQELKKRVEALSPTITVYLTRFSGDILEPLQNAVFSNRLGADLYISLSCYQEQKTPRLSLITFNYESNYDATIKKTSQLSLIPFHKTYREHSQKTYATTHALHALLNSPENKHRIALDPLRAFPYKPLLGVNTVAIGVECGLSSKESWQIFINALVHALEHLLTKT